jgi:hypothetical protein
LGGYSVVIDTKYRTLVDLRFTLDDLSNQSTLKKMLWRGDIADRIATAYKGLGEAVELFNVSLDNYSRRPSTFSHRIELGTRLDLHRFKVEREAARKVDMEQLHLKLTALQHSDHQILDVSGQSSLSALSPSDMSHYL